MTRPWFATVLCVIGLGLIFQVGMAQADLIDLLYDKGQISKEEWLKEKADREKMEAITAERATTEKWYDKIGRASCRERV